jgi:hypothetical protein
VIVETYGTEQLLEDLRAYRCPVHGCEASPRSGSLMCPGHWRLVPADQRREVYEQVRRLERIGKRYERAEPGTKRQGNLATEYLTEEDVLREVQLRAVIVAGERSGARPEPVGSAPQTTPRMGGCMKIKVCRIEDGPARVEVVNPATGESVSCVDVNAGQEVELTLPEVHEADGIQVGEVVETPPQGDAGSGEAAETGEAPAGEGSGEGGEAAGAGEGEAPPA